MANQNIIVLLIFFAIFISTEGRSRFARQVQSGPAEGLEAPPPPPSMSIQPPRIGQQRDLFTLTGPSMDFQRGSVVPAPAVAILRTSDLGRGLDDEDYNEFGSRFADSPAISLPGPPGPPEKGPIYVVPYHKRKSDAVTNPAPVKCDPVKDAEEKEGTTTTSPEEVNTENYLETTTGDFAVGG